MPKIVSNITISSFTVYRLLFKFFILLQKRFAMGRYNKSTAIIKKQQGKTKVLEIPIEKTKTSFSKINFIKSWVSR